MAGNVTGADEDQFLAEHDDSPFVMRYGSLVTPHSGIMLRMGYALTVPDWRLVARLGLAAALLAAGTAFAAEPMLTRDPPPGHRRPGQHVLVDDGSCPLGQVKELTGGGNVKRGSPVAGLPRQAGCVQRPG